MNSKSQILSTATDNELLMRFVRANDDECFEVLVSRHSNLVFQVCQTILSNQSDAEDAFQATFLVLVRKAKCLQHIASLAAWLYKVAYRIAVRSSQTKRRKSTSQIVEEPQSDIDQFHHISQKEILSEVYAELSLLPQKYKDVLVECYLEGRTYREVADATDSNEIAVKGRLAQAKRVLRKRLLKRGIALSFVLVILEQVRSSAAASLLTQTAVSTSLASVASDAAAKIPSSIQSLTSYGARNMSYTFGTKSAGIIVATLITVFLPTVWVLTQSSNAQESTNNFEIEAVKQEVASADVTAAGNLTKVQPKSGLPNETSGVGRFENGAKETSIPVADDGDPTELAYKKAITALSKKTDLIWDDTPIRNVMEDLSKELDMIVELDKMAIQDAGFEIEDLQMYVVAGGRTVYSTLNSAFSDWDLTVVVRNEALLITTNDAIYADPEKYLATRFYNITDLEVDGQELLKLIQKVVDPQSWMDTNGGPGAIHYLENGESQLLIVTQKLTNHLRIERFVSNVRRTQIK